MARYKDALFWIINNDDSQWLDEDPRWGAQAPSTTACLVADLFGKDDETVRADLLKFRDKQNAKQGATTC